MSKRKASGPRQSFVYAIGDTDQRLVKIGYSIDPQRRLNFIQVTCPYTVSILWMEKGDLYLETALHQYFADRRVRGEWFEFPGNAVALISEVYAKMYPQSVHLQPQVVTAEPGQRPERAWEAVRQHLRDQGSRIIRIEGERVWPVIESDMEP